MTARERIPPVTFRDQRLEEKLDARRKQPELDWITGKQADPPSSGAIAKRDLERYYRLLERSLEELESHLSTNELALIAEACARAGLEHPESLEYLSWTVHEAIERRDLDKRWRIDKVALLDKLKRLPLSATWALADLTERAIVLRQREASAEDDLTTFFRRLGIDCSDVRYTPADVDADPGTDFIIDTQRTGTVADADMLDEHE
jgi:hypothetical protein